MNLALLQGVLLILTLVVAFFSNIRACVRPLIVGCLFSFFSHAFMTLLIIFPLHTYWIYATPLLTKSFILKYIIGYCVILCALLIFYSALCGKISLVHNQRKLRWHDPLIAIGGAVFLGGAAAAYFVSRWFINYFGNLTGNQLLFLLTNGQGDATEDVTNQINHYMVVPAIIFAIVGFSIVFIRSDLLFHIKGNTYRLRAVFTRLIAVILSLILLIASVARTFVILPMGEMIDARTQTSEYVEENYVEPAKDHLHFPSQQRNLIHIYMESVENSYYDKAHGGYDDRNLMPELMELNAEGIHFSNTETFGGPHQTSGSEHSIAAMINMWAGIPINTQTGNVFYPDFTTIGDILHEQGYQTSYMLGADADWGNLRQYYQKHGDFNIIDHKVAIERGLIPPDYKVWWGYEDDKLYEFAKNELSRLASENKPFYFVMENADTHFPDGYASPLMTDKPYPEQYANVIHYSQKEVVKFVNWIKQQPFYQNTTIVITGDHQSMDKNFFAGWDPNYERTVVNMILNSAEPAPAHERTVNRDFAPFDMFPTILYSIGIRIDDERLGLGTNLFSSKETLVERDGLEKVNTELRRNSDFFITHKPTQKW